MKRTPVAGIDDDDYMGKDVKNPEKTRD